MKKVQIGIIGGSGLYKLDGIKNVKNVTVTTPFGKPSSKYIVGKLGDKTVAFLPRHDIGHKLLPSELNYRANIYGFKKLGVEQIIAVSAVGSLKEEIEPMHIVIPHQFFDRSTHRHQTFFGEGVVAHIPFANPICMDLAEVLYKAAKKTDANVHWGGTYLNMEGPAFSTKAESEVYRQWGMDIIGMTNLAEAKLAREAEICYSTIALVTDYDCWHPSHETVTVDMVTKSLLKNVETAKKILEIALPYLSSERKCKCGDALKYAFATEKKLIPAKTRKKLKLIIGKHVAMHEANYF
jgi:5'-methylthioadenosine phosphorylase